MGKVWGIWGKCRKMLLCGVVQKYAGGGPNHITDQEEDGLVLGGCTMQENAGPRDSSVPLATGPRGRLPLPPPTALPHVPCPPQNPSSPGGDAKDKNRRRLNYRNKLNKSNNNSQPLAQRLQVYIICGTWARSAQGAGRTFQKQMRTERSIRPNRGWSAQGAVRQTGGINK